MSLDLLDNEAMNAPPVLCLNALTDALFAPANLLQSLAVWNQNAEEEAKQRGSAVEPVTIFQLLAVAQQRLDELEPSNPQHPFWSVLRNLFHATAETVRAESAMRQIAAANDFMRQHPGLGGRWELSPAVQALSEQDREQLIRKVIEFEVFSKECDPWGEHDRGVVLHNGERFCFRIDYFDKDPEAEDAGEYLFAENLAEVTRLLTLKHVGECR